MGTRLVLTVCETCGAYVADELGHRRFHADERRVQEHTLVVLRALTSDLERRAAEVEETAET